MEPVQPSAPDLPVSPSDLQRCTAEPNSVQVALQSAPAPVTSVSEYPLPSASPPLTRSAQRRRRLGGQPTASQERTTKATSVAGVASVSSSRKRRRVTGTQLAEVCRASEAAAAAASQNSNNNEPAEVEGDEGDLTDVEADFEETTAMAMKDRAVQCRYLFAWDMDRTLALLSQARLRHRKDSTADIRTVFTKAERVHEDGTVPMIFFDGMAIHFTRRLVWLGNGRQCIGQ
jgi:hypothetical protein